MKKTALYDKHISLGAKMVPFAGYEMPVSYSGITDEHQTVRNAMGVFDVSHMGEFFLEGKDSLSFLQYLTTNDVSKLFKGRVQYSCLPNNEGGIVDDLLVYQIDENKYMLVVNASNIDKDYAWLTSQIGNKDVKIDNQSDNYSLLAVQGPKVCQALQSLTKVNIIDLPYYHFEIGEFAGIKDVIISATGYTGSGGLELYVKNEFATQLWDKVFEAGASYGIKPIGLGARDTLRLEKGFCLYGNDINDTTSPIEAGLGWITKFGKDFINKPLFEKQKKEGVSKKLVGIELLDKAIARQHTSIVNEEGETIGEVTSGTQTPTLGKSIAMGYVPTNLSTIGTSVKLKIRDKIIEGKVVSIPFLP